MVRPFRLGVVDLLGHVQAEESGVINEEMRQEADRFRDKRDHPAAAAV